MAEALNIGLHSQTLRQDNGVIAGSEVTTQGLQNAFLKQANINSVYRYGPGRYEGLSKEKSDLLIIEGWHPSVPGFIKKVREISPKTSILFWNLSFLGFSEVIKLDVDGYLSNSKKVIMLLRKIAPAELVMLAAETDTFIPLPKEKKYENDVVFLGMNHGHKSHEITNRMLAEAKQFGLAIYGAGWELNQSFKPYWKGILPYGDIPKLYSSAKVVLGITEDRQRNAGMINNRVFEALSCGSCFISEYSPEMERVFGETILFSKQSGDTEKHLERILSGHFNPIDIKEKGRSLVVQEHSYSNRVEQILKFYQSIRK